MNGSGPVLVGRRSCSFRADAYGAVARLPGITLGRRETGRVFASVGRESRPRTHGAKGSFGNGGSRINRAASRRSRAQGPVDPPRLDRSPFRLVVPRACQQRAGLIGVADSEVGHGQEDGLQGRHSAAPAESKSHPGCARLPRGNGPGGRARAPKARRHWPLNGRSAGSVAAGQVLDPAQGLAVFANTTGSQAEDTGQVHADASIIDHRGMPVPQDLADPLKTVCVVDLEMRDRGPEPDAIRRRPQGNGPVPEWYSQGPTTCSAPLEGDADQERNVPAPGSVCSASPQNSESRPTKDSISARLA